MPAGSSSSRPTWGEWGRSLPSRLSSCWRTKAILAICISVLFCVPYFLIGHHALRPVHRLPLTTIDREIGFHPAGWVWIYQSVYLVINVVPWLATSKGQLRKYADGFTIISIISFTIFIFFPVLSPKPAVADARGMYWLLQTYDAPLNSIPSLHASLLVFTLCFGRRIFREGIPIGVGAICIVWALLILYGTLVTKEHYLIDIVSGTVLAFAIDAWIWRRRIDRTAALGSSTATASATLTTSGLNDL